MTRKLLKLILLGVLCSNVIHAAESKGAKIRALLIAGGCCHDYAGQTKVLSKGISERASVQVDVFWTDDKSVNPPLPIYDDPNWAEGYDVVIHDECAAGNRDLKVMENILSAHKTVPAVHLHCAMHSFRNGTDKWFKHIGLQSTRHGPQVPIKIEFTDKKHPITATLKDWTTSNEELYNSPKLYDAHTVAKGTQELKGGKKDVAVVAWTNEKQGARSFSTSLGHNTKTVADPRYLDLVTRGLLWACDKLDEEHLIPYKGENKVTFVKASEQKKPSAQQPKASAAPKDATLVKMTASSEEANKQNYAWKATDRNDQTRWCAAGGGLPAWVQMEFDKPTTLTSAAIKWEVRNEWYQYKIDASKDGKKWETVADQSNNTKGGDTKDEFEAKDVKFLRVTILKQQSNKWGSLWEIQVTGPEIKSIFPKLDQKVIAAQKKADAYKSSGNVPPKIVKLTPAEEEQILKDVRVPEGFEATLFAPAATANYPVYVGAAPNGDLYVSSDGNGSLGRNAHRGRILRLRDKDDDGRADEVTEFVKDIDAPRGIVWDHDRLYVLHPPHITVYFDKDGDGVAEDSKRLISGIAFGFDKRPPDHTTNGLELGIDGWIYIAGGDFGFMDAVGTDGRRLQHRGGGVIRFRPDGTGLELFATGTRNILGTPTSPLLDIFARDNTNDGGGWNVRFHHFSGLEDHGYPRMYKNFGDEHVKPLADYGGGSGCGSVYIHEPGFPKEWAHAPFTCDWGRAGLFHHTVERKGAGFIETSPPKVFIKVTRPTDADVDGMSRVYQASWKGPATFNWAGPDHGYITRVTPKGFTPEPLPDFEDLCDSELVKLLESPSHIRTLTAQRTLLRRDVSDESTKALSALAGNEKKELRSRVAALYAISQRGLDSKASQYVIKTIRPLASDKALAPFVMRALGDMGIDQVTKGKTGPAPTALLAAGAESKDPRTRTEAIIAAARQKNKEAAKAIAESLGHKDPRIAHTAFRALAILETPEPCLDILNTSGSSAEQKQGASFALMRMHKKEVVDALIKLLDAAPEDAKSHILSALTRLYHREAEWKGDSWGTRPDTRGPYYQLETWEESEKIMNALKTVLDSAKAEEAAKLVAEMSRNRIQNNAALTRIIELALKDDNLVSTAVSQLATTNDIPAKAIPLLLKAAQNPDSSAPVLAQSITSLTKVNHPESLKATLSALDALDTKKGEGKAHSQGTNAFLKNNKLDSQHQALADIVSKDAKSKWAHAGLLELASRNNASPEAKATATQALEQAWLHPDSKIILIQLAGDLRNHSLNGKIRAALYDSDKKVVKAAQNAAKRLRIQLPGEDKTPKVATLKPEEAIAQAFEMKGDAGLGEAVYIRAACATCHTTSMDQAQKGPYLGNIANTYRRKDLAESIINPNKSIAQGFATNLITLKDKNALMGFITKEGADEVRIRDVAAKEHTIAKSKIAGRKTLPTSMMPPALMNNFTVKEFASLLDYLEQLSKKK